MSSATTMAVLSLLTFSARNSTVRVVISYLLVLTHTSRLVQDVALTQ